MIEIINIKEEGKLLQKCIEPNIIKLSFNSYGTHIIQKLIIIIQEDKREYINNFIIENLAYISMNINGIGVVKKFISVNKNKEIKNKILLKFELICLEISQDPFGNYAIQYAIDYYTPYNCTGIINEIIKSIINLSIQKFSSNVVEKIIESSFGVK